jgi:hypothetical protein
LGQIVTSAIGVGQLLDWVGFRFAPKLHGILTKAQAVLQLFSLLAKRLMHYQVG